jgi:hypothetical protein
MHNPKNEPIVHITDPFPGTGVNRKEPWRGVRYICCKYNYENYGFAIIKMINWA